MAVTASNRKHAEADAVIRVQNKFSNAMLEIQFDDPAALRRALIENWSRMKTECRALPYDELIVRQALRAVRGLILKILRAERQNNL